jgi:hypothetical protein
VPPEGAEPSTPVHGELVLSLHNFTRASASGYDTELWVYADGRIVWQREDGTTGVPEGASERSTGYLEQMLTPEGVGALKGAALDSGLISGHTQLRVRCGDHPDICFGRISVRGDGERMSLRWSGYRESEPATGAELGTIRGLVARLRDPGSWLPDTAWEDPRIRAFVPSRYLVSFPLYSKPNGGCCVAPDPSQLPPPADEILLAEVVQCVTTDEARGIVEGFEATGVSPSARGSGVALWTGALDLGPGSVEQMFIEPVLPHGSCR